MIRITAASPRVAIADPAANAAESIRMIRSSDADIVLLPELGLTGYTCGDLFTTTSLLQGAIDALQTVADHTTRQACVVVVGLPLRVGTSLMNVAAVLHAGKVVGIVPKTYLPNYREFYETRHFKPAGDHDPAEVRVGDQVVPFGTDLLFKLGDATIAVEICEDLWVPVPPTSLAAIAGADVLLNLSASNELIGKAHWRGELVRSQSGRCIAAYAYASAGRFESTSDLVFGGHCLIAENGTLLDQSRRVGDSSTPMLIDETSVTCDVDLERLRHDRMLTGSFDDGAALVRRSYRDVRLRLTTRQPRATLLRYVDPHPFVPGEPAQRDARCAEIIAIQTAGLAKRLTRIPSHVPLTIGVSGGLDSTLALLIALHACRAVDRDPKSIVGITMPGFGTTGHTRGNAERLIELTGITGQTIDIRQLCLDTFRSLHHRPLGIAIDASTRVDDLQRQLTATPDDAHDLTFENVQARVRTMLLMNRGFVLGTGDMSEQALGWSTYNADHMSMYNVNTSVPKTLVKFLVRYAADHHHDGPLRGVLHDIADTPISPELMPPAADGSIRQSTESTLGNYELHDFFLHHFVRNGFDRQKILWLAGHACFEHRYTTAQISQTLTTFVKRFFSNQFKRNCVPDGPKVGSVSLSPRGDWRMPSDADSTAY